MARVLIIDDEASIRSSLRDALSKRGHECVTADSFAQGQQYARAVFDVVFLDVFLGDGSGIDLLKEIQTRRPETCVVMISGNADIDTAVQAIHLGAYDFIEKPLSLDRILITLDNATRTTRLRSEKERLADIVYGDLIGESEPIKRLRDEIVRSAPRAQRFLVLGENGTGKELAAHMIHRHSRHADGPFIAVNCAALPSELVESELFGHVKGSFTGATNDRAGRFVEADHGTIFLDEISEMPLEAQAKILRVIETRQVTPVGSDKIVTVDCVIIAASNRDLEHMVTAGIFRQDLYYRLNVVTLSLPPLRERLSDIALLAEHFLRRFAIDSGSECKRLEPDAIAALQRMTFRGNVRELKNLMERVNIYCDSVTLSAHDLTPFLPQMPTDDASTLKEAMERSERTHIKAAIDRNAGNVAEAARQLGLERSHLYKKMKKLGL
jgi:two-component system, NtrC family, nitrogen regulation response regulator NtrX